METALTKRRTLIGTTRFDAPPSSSQLLSPAYCQNAGFGLCPGSAADETLRYIRCRAREGLFNPFQLCSIVLPPGVAYPLGQMDPRNGPSIPLLATPDRRPKSASQLTNSAS